MKPLRRAGGVFRELHDALVGCELDLGALRPEDYAPERVERALWVWSDRVQTEFRSIQVMTRFLTEVLGAGDPLDVYAGAVDAIADEVRHTALCAAVVEALGGQPTLPDPVPEAENAEFLQLGMAERALGTAVSMLAISETISTAFIEDLQARCEQPLVRAVLDRTLEDEETHHAFGWRYVEGSLGRFDGSGRGFARMVAETTLAPHRARTEQTLARMVPARRHLEAWPEPELAELGIASVERQALVFERVYAEELAPKLRALGLG